MTGSADWSVIDRKVAEVLGGIAAFIPGDITRSLAESNYHGEPGLVVESMVDVVHEIGAFFTPRQAELIGQLVRLMDMDDSVATRARALVRDP